MKPGLKQFPTDENAAEARECARTFVESRPEFFEDSEEASSCGFPIYPQDKNKYVLFSRTQNLGLASTLH